MYGLTSEKENSTGHYHAACCFILSALFLSGHQPCTGSAQGGAGSNPGGVRRSDDICLHGKNQRNRWRRRR